MRYQLKTDHNQSPLHLVAQTDGMLASLWSVFQFPLDIQVNVNFFQTTGETPVEYPALIFLKFVFFYIYVMNI